MELGYIGLPDGHRVQDIRFKMQEQLMLADHLGFTSAYLPKIDPHQFAATQGAQTHNIKITLDASAFALSGPSALECAVREIDDQLDGRLNLGVAICGPNASHQCKAAAQTFETLFSYDRPADPVFAPSRFPMKSPRPDIVGLPTSGLWTEAKVAATRGYCPMTPSWLPDKEVARIWPAIVAGATSALRRAQPSQWQVNRVVVVHENAQTVHNYLHSSHSPIRRHFTYLAQRGLIDANVDAHLKRVVIAGSAQKVAEEILALREVVGEFGTLNIIDPVGNDANLMRKTMVQLAEEVLPMVTKSTVSHFKNLEKT